MICSGKERLDCDFAPGTQGFNALKCAMRLEAYVIKNRVVSPLEQSL